MTNVSITEGGLAQIDPHSLPPVRCGGLDEDEPMTPAAAPGSVRVQLRSQRDRRRAALVKDFRVPGYRGLVDGFPDSQLFLRCKPVSAARLQKHAERAEKSKDPNANLMLNAAILADFTTAVFAQLEDTSDEVDEDGDPVEPRRVSVDPTAEDPGDPSTWPAFDDQLAESLDLGRGLAASHLVIQLFLKDGDVIATADRLTRWSGFILNQSQDDDEGN